MASALWFANGVRLKRRDLEHFARLRHATNATRRQ
jgi:hypothetical protein